MFLLIFSIMMGMFPEMAIGKQTENDLQGENIVETEKSNIDETANESKEDIVASGVAISSRTKRTTSEQLLLKTKVYVKPTGIEKEKEGILNGHKYFTVGHITVDMPVPEFHKEAYSHKNGKKTLDNSYFVFLRIVGQTQEQQRQETA